MILATCQCHHILKCTIMSPKSNEGPLFLLTMTMTMTMTVDPVDP